MKKTILAGLLTALFTFNANSVVYDITSPNAGANIPRPACVTTNFGGTGTELRAVWQPEYGHGFGWWCVVDNTPKLVGVFIPFYWQIKLPALPAATGPDAFYAWWDLNLRNMDAGTADPQVVQARDAIAAEFVAMMDQYKPVVTPPPPPPPTPPPPPPPPPVEVWVVAKATTNANPPGTRPYYSFTPPSSIGTTVLGRVMEGSPCDCNLAKVVTSSTYCSINGLANRVAVCVKK